MFYFYIVTYIDMITCICIDKYIIFMGRFHIMNKNRKIEEAYRLAVARYGR